METGERDNLVVGDVVIYCAEHPGSGEVSRRPAIVFSEGGGEATLAVISRDERGRLALYEAVAGPRSLGMPGWWEWPRESTTPAPPATSGEPGALLAQAGPGGG